MTGTIQLFIVSVCAFFADIDECASQSHDCAAGFVCENKVGSFACNAKHKCMTGFAPDDHGNCVGKTKRAKQQLPKILCVSELRVAWR